MEAKKPFHETVAERLIKQLKEGTAPWQRPWEPGEPGSFIPTNPTTGKRYRGINAIHLMSQGYSDQRWLTYKQAAGVGAQVRKGEKGTPIQYWKFTDEQTKTHPDGSPVLDAQGQPVKQSIKLERPKVFFATVFNAEQVEGLPPPQPRKEHEWSAIERAEHILQASGAVIRHSEQGRAFYRPATDSIHLPEKGQFPSAANYYATALHELGHWTGHESRLDRDLANPFGSEGYAKEELRAEIASMILGDELGIGRDPGQHAAYVASWIKTLQDDPLEIFRAAADAEKIQEYVLSHELQQQQGNALASQPTPEGAASEGLNNSMDAKMQTARPARDFVASPDRVLDAVTQVAGMSTQEVSARRNAIVMTASARGVSSELFQQRAMEGFGVDMPASWNGQIQVQGNATEQINGKAHVTAAHALGVEPEFWGVYAQQHDGMHQWLADFPTAVQADQLAGQLRLVDALGEKNLHERQAKIARVFEQALRGDPNTTEEELSAAKEARKDAEYAATMNDPDMKRLIAEFDRDDQGLDQPASAQPIKKGNAPPKEVNAKEWWNAQYEILMEGAQSNDDVAEGMKALGPEPGPDEKFLIAHDGSRVVREPEKVPLNVPYSQKNEAKALGAKWDRNGQTWYVPPGVDPVPFAKWMQEATGAAVAAPDRREAALVAPAVPAASTGREYLAVPYGERIAAKAAGAEWDKTAKSWYAGPQADMAKLARWKPENVPDQQEPAMTPQEEFAEALRAVGCVVTGEHPIMDGQKHRITVEGEKHSDKAGSGFYVGHLDGHPAGYIKNNKTGIDMKWKSKGYALDENQKATMAAEAAAKLQARDAEQAQAHDRTAQRVSRQMADLTPIDQPTPYLRAKGIEPQPGVFTDKEGKTTYVPAVDVEGKQWTTQYIQEDGTKRFAKDSRKEGCFHVVGGLDALALAPALVIGEGYATAGTLAKSLGFATVAAFDSGNLVHVAKVLHEKYPDKPVIIAGDDDRHLELTQGVNPGKTKAQEAAKATGGKALLPIFAPGESSYPAHLDPVTPELYRQHQHAGNVLSESQLAALTQMKKHTDFNDLANQSSLGAEGVRRQLCAIVEASIEAVQTRKHQQVQENEIPRRRAAKIGA